MEHGNLRERSLVVVVTIGTRNRARTCHFNSLVARPKHGRFLSVQVLTSHTLKVLFSLVNCSSVTTFIRGLVRFDRADVNHRRLSIVSFLPAFLKSNGSSLSAPIVSTRREREMKMRSIAFSACQLSAYSNQFDWQKRDRCLSVVREVRIIGSSYCEKKQHRWFMSARQRNVN